jgi:hypothetical protein
MALNGKQGPHPPFHSQPFSSAHGSYSEQKRFLLFSNCRTARTTSTIGNARATLCQRSDQIIPSAFLRLVKPKHLKIHFNYLCQHTSSIVTYFGTIKYQIASVFYFCHSLKQAVTYQYQKNRIFKQLGVSISTQFAT